MPSGLVPHYQPCLLVCCLTIGHVIVQWLSGRVLDSRPRGQGFEPHQHHCVVVLEQDTFILAKYWFNTGRPVPVKLKIVDGT